MTELEQAATGSQLITQARSFCKRREKEPARRIVRGLVPFAEPLPTAELERLAELCEELGLMPEEVEVRTLLVTRSGRRSGDWRRLAKLHKKLGDRRAAARCRARARDARRGTKLHATSPRWSWRVRLAPGGTRSPRGGRVVVDLNAVAGMPTGRENGGRSLTTHEKERLGRTSRPGGSGHLHRSSQAARCRRGVQNETRRGLSWQRRRKAICDGDEEPGVRSVVSGTRR